MSIQTNLDLNIRHMQDVFTDCGDVVGRKFPVGEHKNIWVYITYIDMLISRDTIENTIMNTLMMKIRQTPPTFDKLTTDIFDSLKDGGIATADLKESTDFDEVVTAILSGDTAIFVDGFQKAIVVSTKGFPNRGIQQTDTEVVIQGSKEAFTEAFRFNTVLVRRRIRDTHLKVKQLQVGRRSKTDIALMYLDDVVRPHILEEALSRIHDIDIDAILDSGYIEQLIEDDWISPFPQTQVTERPDKAAAAILEGRIAIIVDNTPFVILIPATLNVFYQASEDYYQRFHIMSFIRVIRYIAGLFAIALPGMYIATAVYHPSMIPMLLVFKMSASRQTVPIPAVVEIIVMELAFELLREAGIRLPAPIGSTIGIVGGIIIGQAAVEAGLVSPIVVIIVALTGICSFAIPHISLVSGYRLMKYLIIFMAAFLGLFGFWIAVLLILIHLVSLKSFGIPYLFPFASGDINGYTDLKDTIFRLPLFMMKKRPFFANPDENVRLNDEKTGNSRRKE